MIIDCAIYKDGRRSHGELPIPGSAKKASEEGAFVWIGLYEPTRKELREVSMEFGLHELAIEDAMRAHQRPKLESYDDSLVAVLKTARYLDKEEEVEFGEIIMIVGDHFIVVVRHGAPSGLAGVRNKLENRPDLLELGPSAVLHAVMDHVVDGYGPVVNGLAKDIDEIEREVFTNEWSNPAERIYFLQREVLEFRNAVRPLGDPVHRLSLSTPMVHPDAREYFRNVHDHVVRVAADVENQRDLLTSALEANLAQIGVRQNEDMRKISAWIAVAAVPTLIAGIFGMNFPQISRIHEVWALPGTLALMAVIATSLYFLFRRSGWL